MDRKFLTYILLLSLSSCEVQDKAVVQAYDVTAQIEKEINYFSVNKDAFSVKQKVRIKEGTERNTVSSATIITALEEIKSLDLNRVIGNKSYRIDTTYKILSDSNLSVIITYTLKAGENSPIKILILESDPNDNSSLRGLQFLRIEKNILFTAEQKCLLTFEEGHVKDIALEGFESTLFTDPMSYFTQISARKMVSYSA